MLRPATWTLALSLSLGCAEAGAPRADYAPDGALDGDPGELAPTNVLLISIDTLRADYLGAYGQALPTSPVLDALAREGVVFERALSCSPWTTPAHVSLMTSLYPETHGILDYPYPGMLDDTAVTLAEILRAHGFATAGFTEGGYAKGATGLGHGFDVFPDWPRDDGFESHELEPSRLVENVERALAWLEGGPDEPFLLFFHTYEPHHEYRPPREYVDVVAPRFDHAAEERKVIRALSVWNAGERDPTPRQLGVLYRHYVQGDLRVRPVARQRRLTERLRRFVADEWRISPGFEDDLRYVEMLYAAEIRFTDDVVARLFDRLRALDLWERTLVVVTSDHGEGLMDHDELQHGSSLFDELLHVPLIVRFPSGRHAGRRHAGQVRSIDVVPTILDEIGLPIPRAAAGRSLLPVLFEAEPLPAFAEALTAPEHERDVKMIDDGRWKLIRNVRTDRELLFDLSSDPNERTDVASREPHELDRLRDELDQTAARNRRRGEALQVAPGEFSAAEKRQLEALGYVGADDD